MEYRKFSNTPRERIDDDMLERILNEEDLPCCSYGDSMRQAAKRNGCGCGTGERRVMPRQEMIPPADDNEICPDGCGKKNCLSGYPLAMAYTPDQIWQNLYCDEDALSHGTMFTELYKPFYHGCSGNCR